MQFDTARTGPDEAAERQTGSLAGLAIILLLIVIGLHLINVLRAQADLEDCVMSGHAGCDMDTTPKSLSVYLN